MEQNNQSEKVNLFTAKPLFIVNKVNQNRKVIREFRKDCETEYLTLTGILTDYHVLYFANNYPDENYLGINNYDVRYPNQVPDIEMTELLAMVEHNLAFNNIINIDNIPKEGEETLSATEAFECDDLVATENKEKIKQYIGFSYCNKSKTIFNVRQFDGVDEINTEELRLLLHYGSFDRLNPEDSNIRNIYIDLNNYSFLVNAKIIERMFLENPNISIEKYFYQTKEKITDIKRYVVFRRIFTNNYHEKNYDNYEFLETKVTIDDSNLDLGQKNNLEKNGAFYKLIQNHHTLISVHEYLIDLDVYVSGTLHIVDKFLNLPDNNLIKEYHQKLTADKLEVKTEFNFDEEPSMYDNKGTYQDMLSKLFGRIKLPNFNNIPKTLIVNMPVLQKDLVNNKHVINFDVEVKLDSEYDFMIIEYKNSTICDYEFLDVKLTNKIPYAEYLTNGMFTSTTQKGTYTLTVKLSRYLFETSKVFDAFLIKNNNLAIQLAVDVYDELNYFIKTNYLRQLTKKYIVLDINIIGNVKEMQLIDFIAEIIEIRNLKDLKTLSVAHENNTKFWHKMNTVGYDMFQLIKKDKSTFNRYYIDLNKYEMLLGEPTVNKFLNIYPEYKTINQNNNE